MKRIGVKVTNAALVIAAVLTSLTTGHAQSIDWFKVSGGGNVSTGGQYSITGTIGQSDAGAPIVGGAYSITGGFWSLLVVPSFGAPQLSIRTTPTNSIVVSWPSSAIGFALQQTGDVGSGGWSIPAEVVQDDGVNKSITVYPPAERRFYRLFKP